MANLPPRPPAGDDESSIPPFDVKLRHRAVQDLLRSYNDEFGADSEYGRGGSCFHVQGIFADRSTAGYRVTLEDRESYAVTEEALNDYKEYMDKKEEFLKKRAEAQAKRAEEARRAEIERRVEAEKLALTSQTGVQIASPTGSYTLQDDPMVISVSPALAPSLQRPGIEEHLRKRPGTSGSTAPHIAPEDQPSLRKVPKLTTQKSDAELQTILRELSDPPSSPVDPSSSTSRYAPPHTGGITASAVRTASIGSLQGPPPLLPSPSVESFDPSRPPPSITGSVATDVYSMDLSGLPGAFPQSTPSPEKPAKKGSKKFGKKTLAERKAQHKKFIDSLLGAKIFLRRWGPDNNPDPKTYSDSRADALLQDSKKTEELENAIHKSLQDDGDSNPEKIRQWVRSDTKDHGCSRYLRGGQEGELDHGNKACKTCRNVLKPCCLWQPAYGNTPARITVLPCRIPGLEQGVKLNWQDLAAWLPDRFPETLDPPVADELYK